MVFGYDRAIVSFVSSLQGHWPTLDRVLVGTFQMNTFKMMPIVTIVFGLWFAKNADDETRLKLFSGVTGGFCALVVTRLIQNCAPHQPRPIFSGDYSFLLSLKDIKPDWSSFPSDTSALAFALAYAAFRVSRPWGAFAFVWAAVVISFPRVYGGYHYPTDIVCGAVIGMACVAIYARLPIVPQSLFLLAKRVWALQPALFHAGLFILAFQLSTYFDDIRHVSQSALETIGIVRSGAAHNG